MDTLNSGKITIIGAGWLGEALGLEWLREGQKVWGTTTTPQKIAHLEALGFTAELLQTEAKGVKGNVSRLLENTHTLILNIPPGLRKDHDGDPEKALSHLMEYMLPFNPPKILFVSSTGVFEDTPKTFTEKDTPNADSFRGRSLIQLEQHITSAFPQTTLLRCGGLLGGDRHPVKYLSGKTGIERPLAPVNLIHRDDVIGIIKTWQQYETHLPVIHAVSPHHPSRKAYYEKAAQDLNLPKPLFAMEDIRSGKRIDSVIIGPVLPYTFTKPYL